MYNENEILGLGGIGSDLEGTYAENAMHRNQMPREKRVILNNIDEQVDVGEDKVITTVILDYTSPGY